MAELDSLRPSSAAPPQISLITLDIPCVSFVRLPPKLDPVSLVHGLCMDASHNDPSQPRSRYIKRLTPVSLIRKTLNNGIEALCDIVLRPHFEITPESGDQGGVKYAIRPTIRNNNQIHRDEVIKVVAEKIARFGLGRHKVDLGGYEKLVFVDVYRNVVGMSVVVGGSAEYERLKRYNLAEIYAERRKEVPTEAEQNEDPTRGTNK